MSDMNNDDSGMDGRAPRRPRFNRLGRGKGKVTPEMPLDYKNVDYLSRFISAQGKIVSRKRSGFSGQDQRKLAVAIKRARFVGLLPYVGRT